MIRLAWVAAVTVVATLWYGARILGASYLRKGRSQAFCEREARGWARALLWAAGVKVVLENEARLDPGVPQVLVANHVSWFDTLVLAAWIPGTYRFVAKKELARVPIFGRSAAACGHIFIDRGDRASAIDSLSAAQERIARDKPTVIVFPEGTRSPTGALQRFKKGAFVLAIQAGADVVPAVIEGSREIMPKGSWRITPGTVRVRFGEPIAISGYSLERRGDLTHDAREAVLTLQRPTTGTGQQHTRE